MTSKLRISSIFLVFLLLFTTSCIKTVQPIGYTFDEKMLEKIIPNESSQAVVQQFLGSPSSKSVFGKETWFYIAQQYENRAFLKPILVSQKVVAIEFDNQVVSAIKTYTANDVKDVELVKDATPAEGHDIGIAGQLLGNIGRFNSKGRKAPGEP